jgi:integrase
MANATTIPALTPPCATREGSIVEKDNVTGVTDGELIALIEFAPSRTLSPATKTSYIAQINAAMKIARRTKRTRTIYGMLRQPKFFETLAVPLTTKYAYSAAFYSLFKRARVICCDIFAEFPTSIKIKWDILIEKLKRQRERLVRENIRTEKEKKNWVTIDELKELDARLRSEERGSQRQLLIAFHVRIPPLRGGDLSYVVFAPEGRNHLDLKDGKGFLRVLDHKTRKLYGTLRRFLPEDLVKDVELSLEAQPRTHLFARGCDPHKTRAQFVKWKNDTFYDLLGKRVTTNIIRHVYVSSGDFNKLSLQNTGARARQLGHSFMTHLAYRRVDGDSTGETSAQGGVLDGDATGSDPLRPLSTVVNPGGSLDTN